MTDEQKALLAAVETAVAALKASLEVAPQA